MTIEERNWIAAHPHIVLGLTDQFQPTLIRGKDGTLSGLAIDYLQLLNQCLGLNMTLHVESDFSQVTKKAMGGEIDGLFYSSPNPNPTWDKYFLYTTPFFQSYFYIYKNLDDPTKELNLQSLQNKKVGYLKRGKEESLFSLPRLVAFH